MTSDDTLYDRIRSHDGIRTERQKISDAIEIEYTVTTKDRQEDWSITTIIIQSGGPPVKRKVIVDGRTIAEPLPVYNGDFCLKQPQPQWVSRDGYRVPLW